jgi:glycine/D-amino acid oxidase-like deaminating enzyme
MHLERGMSGLAMLAAQVRADLERIAHPNMPWLTPVIGPDGRPALDVLIIGAGQSGLATAFALQRSQVTNVLVLDKAEKGSEGPWLTNARMPTLRSPKSYTGPDLDIPSLTYQAWHEAKFGEESWHKLDLISRECWADYLLWYRHVLDLPGAQRPRAHRHRAGSEWPPEGDSPQSPGRGDAVLAQDRARDGSGGHG